MYNGLVNIYKEVGFTSFDVVAKLRGILKQKKIGHTGTLDPAAEGVLLVCLGDGTKLCDMLEDRSKEYECVMLLGTETDTEDTTGKVLKSSEVNCSDDEIKEAAKSFLGDYAQVPPMYSALKVNGKKMYELARQGIEIERKARNLYIDYINITKIEKPYVTFTVSCSKGTYIRSLCRDIGQKLGCGATMEHLTRRRVGPFTIDNAVTLEKLEELRDNNLLDNHIISLEEVFIESPMLFVKEGSAKYINNGNPLSLNDIDYNFLTNNPNYINLYPSSSNCLDESMIKEDLRYRIYNADKKFTAIYKYDKNKNLLMPEKMFPNL